MPLYNHQPLKIYNSLSGEKEPFVPVHEGNVGMYVCGPTVYSNVHLGNVRTFLSFDFVGSYRRPTVKYFNFFCIKLSLGQYTLFFEVSEFTEFISYAYSWLRLSRDYLV